jgi:hypothetical protein
MGDIDLRYKILENENKEGLYLIDFDKSTYIAYIENINIIKNIDEPIADSEELEKLGIYLLKNIREALNFSEEKTKKMIKYLYYENIIKSKSFKLFILLLETYIIYYQTFLSAAVKNPLLIDFFENGNINIEIMKRLFNYLVGTKILENKIEILKFENILNDLFVIIDKYKNIFNKDVADPLLAIILFKEIVEKLIDIKYEDSDIKYYIEKLIKVLSGNINYDIPLSNNT